MPKNVQSTHTIALISHTSKVRLKVLQARLQQYVNREMPDVQAGFREGRGTRDQIANTSLIIGKAKEFKKKSTSASLTTLKPLTVWITTNYGKWEYQTTLPAPREISMQFKKQQLKLNMEQQTDFNLGKEYIKTVYCHPVYLTYMQSTSCEMLDWTTHKLESRLLEEISTISDMQMI